MRRRQTMTSIVPELNDYTPNPDKECRNRGRKTVLFKETIEFGDFEENVR